MSSVFVNKKRKLHLPLEIVAERDFSSWIKKQSKALKNKSQSLGFQGKAGQIIVMRDTNEKPKKVIAGSGAQKSIYDYAAVAGAIEKKFTASVLQGASFEFAGLNKQELTLACVGWGLAGYHFSTYKKAKPEKPVLVLPSAADKKRIKAFVEAAVLVREMINLPANDFGPEELESEAKKLAKSFGAKIKVIADKALLTHNFPMIYAVGKASERPPRLIDLTWGDPKHKKLTLVGKGVCFDTGGLDIKPSKSMLTMKKDMGGAAHVLGLAHLIMTFKLPVRLRVLIPAVENSISDEAYRPWDILRSRKGLTVEVGNTDAEGRLILADALALACEEKPDLLIDFATLTGAHRIALGFDLPGLFATSDETAKALQELSMEIDDPVWHLPLWAGYRKELESANADISSTGGLAGAITAALFLKEFVNPDTEWVHFDLAAWEERGRPGKAKGGLDMGMRAVFAYLEQRYN